jgi:hypothetical protein
VAVDPVPLLTTELKELMSADEFSVELTGFPIAEVAN